MKRINCNKDIEKPRTTPNKDTHKRTKYLIPTLKPNQFDPISITGDWEYIASKKRWICHNATPHPYSEMEINERALVDNVN